MIGKNKITEIKQLHQKKYREERQLFIVEGSKSVLDLLQSDITVKEIFCTEEWQMRHLKQISTSFTLVTEKEMERISCLTTPQQVLATAILPQRNVAEIEVDKSILLLDNLRDPGNLGTIIRSADWFGIKQILCSEQSVEYTNPKTIQASMGSFSRVKVFYDNLESFLISQKGKRKVRGTFLEGDPIHQVQFLANDILIIGNESTGISENITQFVTQKIHIPTFSAAPTKAESLNASIATAILLYQFAQSINQ